MCCNTQPGACTRRKNHAKKLQKAGFEECRFNTGEVEMNYVVGPNNGPALLLIPAQMGTWESYQHVREQLHETQQEIREVTNGYTFRYPVDDSVLSLLTEFIDLEGRCCSFLNFTLDVKTERGPAWLTLTGPDGVKEFLRAEMSIDENLS